MTTFRKAFILLASITIFFLFSACRNRNSTSIPDAPVDLRLNLTINYNTFRAPLEHLEFEERNDKIGVFYVGYAGILVNINADGAYRAFDMACPYEKDPKVKVRPNDTGSIATCEKCGSQYDLVYGFGQVTKGPSKEGLRKYETFVRLINGADILMVTR